MDTPVDPNSEIQKFYAGTTILLTGATGFLGKLVLEKLLRSCSQIKKIYILVRNKRGKTSETRLDELFQSEAFQDLDCYTPNYKEKVGLINGNTEEVDLGLNEEDWGLLSKETNIIIHCAATVRFDETLIRAAHINVRATRDLLRLGHETKHLKAFIYVSTTYSNCWNTEIDEKIYDVPITCAELLKTVDSMDADQLKERTPEILGKWPNTYIFTKAIAEHTVLTEGRGLPRGILRPSIIMPASKEPFEGWIDNFFGPVSISILACLGVNHLLYGDKEAVVDIMPVDYVVNSVVAAAWDSQRSKPNDIDSQNVTFQNLLLDESKTKCEVQVYNCCSSYQNPLLWKEYSYWFRRIGDCVPSNFQVWHYWFFWVKNYNLFIFLSFFVHILPGYVMDFGLKCAGRPPMVIKIFKKLHSSLDVLGYFSSVNWLILNNNMQNMNLRMTPKDRKLFYTDISKLEWHRYLYTILVGGRRYLLRDKSVELKDFKSGIVKRDILEIVHYIVVALMCYSLYKLFSFTSGYIYA